MSAREFEVPQVDQTTQRDFSTLRKLANDGTSQAEKARRAAAADAAATMIANAVDVDDPAVARRPARELKDDSDLGDLLVTAGVGITVFTGMIASTCLAVLFVPSLFVVIQRFEEWLARRKAKPVAAAPAE